MNTEHILSELKDMTIELNSTNSKNDKIDILSKYPTLKNVLLYTYDPYRMFGVSPKNLQKNSHLFENTITDLFELLDMLSNREITGHKAISVTNGFIKTYSEYKELIYNILEKNLKTRTDAKVINKVFPGLIPTFDVALAHKYEDHAHKINWDTEDWYWTRKLDGVRVITRKENGVVTFYSRKGKEFHTLSKVKTALENMRFNNFVLDGEMCIVDDNGNEDFTAVVSQIRKKDYTIENPKYIVFDCLTLDEFDSKKSDVTLTERMPWNDLGVSTYIERLEMTLIKNGEAEIIELLDMANDKGWEGIMVRRDYEYEGKRTRNLLKVKKMFDAEYKVIRVETGPFRIISKETGLEETIETLTNVIIEHKGEVVSVGSGFSLDQRHRYYNDNNLILGKEITVQYFEESTDKTGKISLRFPTVKHVFEDGIREV
ncbi:hypothetical protein HOE22_09335 [Candidatus Woesearchaeota archaeon]|nr:hypothetical protein [Candidatus Woesearchaeota archaeon]MBT4732609.1 hypothetical protein [Candidatus Woesearchaeota archaeon]MBT7557460.1 hypothetical protein [Candidatus Woesearchaeota archaeon]